MADVVVPKKEPRIFCNDECGNSVPDDPINLPIEGTGWERLQIQMDRYRCIECQQKLKAINDNH